jgi:hypothetical protein
MDHKALSELKNMMDHKALSELKNITKALTPARWKYLPQLIPTPST